MGWCLYKRQCTKIFIGILRGCTALGLGILGTLSVPSAGHSREAFMVADVPLPLETPAVRLLESGRWDDLARLFVNGTSPNVTSADKEPLLVVAARRDSMRPWLFCWIIMHALMRRILWGIQH